MSLRIRTDGRIFCAALHPEMPGDTYIDDGLHYEMSVIHKVLVTEPMPQHAERGEWWWRSQVPADVVVDEFYAQVADPQKTMVVLRELVEAQDYWNEQCPNGEAMRRVRAAWQAARTMLKEA